MHSENPQNSPSDAEIAKREASRKKRIIILGLGSLILGGLLFGAMKHPAVDVRLDELRAVWLAKKVTRLRAIDDKQDLTDAVVLAGRSYALAPENPTVIRSVAELYHQLVAPLSIVHWETLSERDLATTKDRSSLAIDYLRFGRLEEAMAMADELENGEQLDDIDFVKLRAMLLVLQKRRPEAQELLASYNQSHPDDSIETEVILGAVKLAGDDNSDQADGLERLWKIAMEDDEEPGIKALRTLTQSNQSITGQRGKQLATRLDTHPLATGSDKVQAGTLRIKLWPDDRLKIVEDTIASIDRTELPSMAALFRWLEQQNLDPKILELYEDRIHGNHPITAGAYLNALAKTGKWRDLMAVLNSGGLRAIPPYQKELFQAYAIVHTQGKPDAAERHLKKALTSVRKFRMNSEALKIAQFSQAYQFDEVAEEAFRFASRGDFGSEAAFRGLTNLLLKRQATSELLRVSEEMVQRFPANREASDRLRYLHLVKGNSIESVLQDEAEPVEGEVMPVLVSAIAQLRMDNYAAAKDLVADLDPSTLTAGAKAICSALQTGSVPSDLNILPEENSLLQMALGIPPSN